VHKGRALVCPPGYKEKSTAHGTVCTAPLEICEKCGGLVGNPVTPATGVKVQAETDYRHPQGLELTRYYHSFRFYEPFTTAPDSHSHNQFDISWRSGFDKRVIPLSGFPAATAALTLPSGEVQYFDTAGNEVLNYRGATSKLVSLANGYVYLGPDEVELYGSDGRLQSITRRTGQSLSLGYSDGTTTGPNGAFAVDAGGQPTTLPVPVNLLLRVTDSWGHALAFDYSAAGRVVAMTDAGGGRHLYAYDASNNLSSVTRPDGSTRAYRYNEPANMVGGASLQFALTSIVDENGAVFASFKYDATGRAVSTEHAGGAERYALTYNADGSSTVTDPLGTSRRLGFQAPDGLSRFTGSSVPGGAGYGSGVQNRALDAKGNTASQTDFNGATTCYAYDPARNLETVRVEGLPSATGCDAVTAAGATLPAGSRKIVTEWHARWRMPARVSEPGRRTTYVYNGDGGASCAPAGAVIADGSPAGQPIGVLCTRTLAATADSADGAQGFAAAVTGAPRTAAYAYDAHGNVLSADGPRTDAADVTTYSYYADGDPDAGKRGQIATITNALGHVTGITAYNAHGQPTAIVDANGLVTALGYDARQRLRTRNVGGETTSYDYDLAGQLTKVTLPDGSFLSYTYDAAHRLTGMSDVLGNRIAYTLDAMGNRTQEQVFDPANALAQTRSRVYDALNRLYQDVGAQSQTTQYGYDDQGNVVSIADPLNRVTANAYDSLSRLIRVTDPASGQTQYAYNGIDQLTGVTDPRTLTTGYAYDGLGNLNQQSSPDTGTTQNTYDAAGNLLTQTDAKGQVTIYTYDALNRVASVAFNDGSTQSYAYDQGANGIGRLAQITEADAGQQLTGRLAYAYDAHGRVASETRTIAGVAYVTAYQYDAAGRMTGATYPSGRQVSYTLDALGRIQQVSTLALNGAPEIVASSVAYQPFGGVKSWTLGNGRSYVRGYDLDGRVASYSLRDRFFALGYDAASRITFLADADNPAAANTYGYDALDRLTQAVIPQTPFAYAYDAVGNRTSKTVGSATDTYAYAGTSNRIASITAQAGAARAFTFDPNGSTTADGVNQYGYDARGRMVQSVGALGTTAYQVNALGQRIRKTNAGDDRIFHYDTKGRLIAETDPGGALKREYIYLGDIPIAVVQ
jgi:YD repeat-containing protein